MKRTTRKRPKRPPPPKRPRLTGPIHGRILALREGLGLTQHDLAQAVGVHTTAVSHWEQRCARPSLTRLAAVARALGVTVDELIAGERVA